jgi:hypothetical protein
VEAQAIYELCSEITGAKARRKGAELMEYFELALPRSADKTPFRIDCLSKNDGTVIR